MPKTILQPEGLPVPSGRSFSQVAVAGQGRLVFIAGQTASDANADIREQTWQVLEKVRRGVEAAGGTLADIVSTTVYITDQSFFGDVNDVRREAFGGDFPTSTMVVVVGLVRPGLLVE